MTHQLSCLSNQTIKVALLLIGSLTTSHIYAADGGINTALAEAGCIQSAIKGLCGHFYINTR